MNANVSTSDFGDLPLAVAANAPMLAEIDQGASPIAQRLCHLFRASLKDGRLHPLYLPTLRYRHTQLGGEAR